MQELLPQCRKAYAALFRLYVYEILPIQTPTGIGQSWWSQMRKHDRQVRRSCRFFACVRLGYHEFCILLEDAAVTLLIGLTEIASRYRLPDSEMVEFPGMGFHSHNQIPEALPIGKLTEDHRKQLES